MVYSCHLANIAPPGADSKSRDSSTNMARRTLRAGTRARGTRELDARGLQTPTRSGLSSCAGTGGGFGGGTGGGGSGGGELYS